MWKYFAVFMNVSIWIKEETLKLKIISSKNIVKLMSTVDNSKHQTYFKQAVISAESSPWQPFQELLQAKTVETQYLFRLSSSMSTFSWVTTSLIPKSNTKRDFWLYYKIFMEDMSISSEKFPRKRICKALRALPNCFKFYIISAVFLTSLLMYYMNNFISNLISTLKIPNHLFKRWKSKQA